ncbi:MAG: trimethylamine methyltransferase family protein [Anaerolineae bacterium]|nr:trimethylamine methyltransferase family protein [Anaerolineae bacterium]
MHVAGHAYDLMSPQEVDLIHQSALRILDQVGIEIQDHRLLEALAGLGAQIDKSMQRARFPPHLVERFIIEADKFDWERAVPRVRAAAGVYHGLYHDPVSGELVPWTEESLAFYFCLARRLSEVDGASMLGCRLPVPPALEPLYERYYCWKYGAGEGGSIYTDEICPYLLELYQARAEERQVPLDQAFRATVYLVPPLKLGRHEAYQVATFWEWGLRVRIGGGMGAMGATAPVTLAGAVTLNLAEQLALRLLDWALFGEKRLHVGAGLSVMDMRTTIRPYGRPEMAIANLMTAQLARHYGASFSGQAGLSDAKLPSVEAGAQKALTAVPTLLAGGSVWLDAGLLSIDEVFSPVQMVLDNEFLGALKRFVHEFQITQETIGLETIVEAGPGGHFLDKQHTVAHFREEHWNPTIWSRRMLRPWMEEGRHLDADKAREVARQVLCEVRQRGWETGEMSASLEREVLRTIESARCALHRE